MARRKVGKVTGGAVGGLRETGEGFRSRWHLVNQRFRAVGDRVGYRYRAVGAHCGRRQTQGNPLAAGLVAVGAGLVVAALFRASEQEQQAAEAVKETATEAAGTLKEEGASAA